MASGRWSFDGDAVYKKDMKVVLAPDSFKGSLTAVEVARHLAAGVRRVFPNAVLVSIPVADGGEGTVEALVSGLGGGFGELEATGPLGTPVRARFGVLPDGAGVVEMAAASGLPLVPPHLRNPLATTTRGAGELIAHLLDLGCRRIILGVGGSATNDGGVGMAQALGWSFVDANGNELGPGGGALSDLVRIDGRNRDRRLDRCEILVASDVTNPLVGVRGASAVYAPQKGADPAMVRLLDANLTKLADAIERHSGKRYHDTPGGGAAGGLGVGLMAFCGASLRPGIEIVLEAVGFKRAVADADLVLTGEGCIDGQSVYGKVPVGVAAWSRNSAGKKIPVVAVVGGVGAGADAVYDHGIDALIGLSGASFEDSMARAGELVEAAAERALRLIRIGQGL